MAGVTSRGNKRRQAGWQRAAPGSAWRPRARDSGPFCPNIRASVALERFPLDASLFTAELDRHRRYLVRVAQLQLRDADLAEDVVQETLLAALGAREGFHGRSSVKTWLTGILKHKIVDAIRQKQRQPVVAGDVRRGNRPRRVRPAVQGQRRLGGAACRLGRSGERAVPPRVPRGSWSCASRSCRPTRRASS